jgi:methionyl aminopeptidase
MRIIREPGVQIKTPAQLGVMWQAGQVVAAALEAAAAAVAPGVTTAELDGIARELIASAGAASSFLGYHGYPATICASVNDEIVHGIPSASRVLREGDVISIDCGASVDGWHADAALTVGVGAITPELTRLIADCERALWQGIAAARPGAHLSDISHAVERSVRMAGAYGIVEDYVGHGIGTEMHMDPPVPNYGKPGRGPVLRAGMALAIEPLLVLGGPDTRLLADDWTVVSEDGGWSAHFEHTVAVTADGPWVLTASAPPRPGVLTEAGVLTDASALSGAGAGRADADGTGGAGGGAGAPSGIIVGAAAPTRPRPAG